MRYLIEHKTRLTFADDVKEHQCEMRLKPIEDQLQRVHEAEVDVEPQAELFAYTDSFGNAVHHCSLVSPHKEIVLRLHADVETFLDNPFEYDPVPVAREQDWIRHSLRDVPRLWAYVVHHSDATPTLQRIEHDLEIPGYAPNRPLIQSVQEAMAWIHGTFDYDPVVTHVHTSLEEVLELRAGVCQDFAHLLISVVRSWGFPARYVMGYQDAGYFEKDNENQEADAEAGDDEDLPQATHAWAEVLIPGAGWRGFDATHNLLADSTFIRVAVGRDHHDAAPQRGSYKGDQEGSPPEVSLRVSCQQ